MSEYNCISEFYNSIFCNSEDIRTTLIRYERKLKNFQQVDSK